MASKDTFVAEVPKKILYATEYIEWSLILDGSFDLKIMSVIERIESDGIITNVKNLSGGLYEKKWHSGLRLYFAVINLSAEKSTLLVIGSGKGKEQERAIGHARKILKFYDVSLDSIKKDEE